MSDLEETLQRTLSGNYTIERELGGGGMSRVFVAEETSLGRKVVVKVLPPELAASVNLERFRREIQVAARLSHPHIVPVLAAGSSDGLPYYTMPFIEGESLRARIARHGELPNHDAAKVLRDVLSALAYAHEHGVVHRDIKPDNILLSGGHALVADFGVAKALSASTAPGSSLTSMGVALGTPAYMAPEQAVGDPSTDHRADLYAIGAVAYEMLTGYQLFSARSPQAMLAAHAAETPEPILKKRPSVPPLLAALVMRSLEKRPADRPQSAGEMLAQLEAATTPSGATTPYGGGMQPHVPSNRKRNAAIAAAGGAAIVAALVVGLFRSKESDSPAGQTAAVVTPALAVLPLENLGSADDAYFADGMTEEISGRLGRLSGLRVIGRQSVRGYANSTKSVQQIGKELGVEYILTGSIRWDKSTGTSRVRVSPALLKVTDGSQVWSEAYEDVVTGVFQIQSSVAEKVAAALRVQLTSRDAKTLAERPTDNVEAYDLFLRAEALSGSRVIADYLKVISLLERAVKLDPQFTAAYARLGDANADAFWFGDYRNERLTKARAAIDRALALDPNSPKARSASANYYYHGKRDFDRALTELAVAERLAPNDTYTRLVKARVLRRQAKFSEAIKTYQQVLAIDARNILALIELTETYAFAGRADDAIKAGSSALQVNPTVVQPYMSTGAAWVSKGNLANALAGYRQASENISPRELGANLLSLSGEIWPSMLEPKILQAMREQPPPENPGAQVGYYAARGILAVYEKRPDQMRAAGLAMKRIVEKQWPNAWNDGSDFAGTGGFTSSLAMGHAFLGEKAKAMELASKALAQLSPAKDAIDGPSVLENFAHVAVLTSNHDAAVSALERLIALRGRASPATLRLDPKWDLLRTNPRFMRLTEAN